jgi:hypothetical protein
VQLHHRVDVRHFGWPDDVLRQIGLSSPIAAFGVSPSPNGRGKGPARRSRVGRARLG